MSTVVRLHDSLLGQLTERRDKVDRFEETAKQFCDGDNKEETSHKRLVYPMLSVSLDCPFVIAPSVVSNVYLYTKCVMNNNNKIT